MGERLLFFLITSLFLLQSAWAQPLYEEVGIFKLENRVYFCSDLKEMVEGLTIVQEEKYGRIKTQFNWTPLFGLTTEYQEQARKLDYKTCSAWLKENASRFLPLVYLGKLLEFTKNQRPHLDENENQAIREISQNLSGSKALMVKTLIEAAAYFAGPRFREESFLVSEGDINKLIADHPGKSRQELEKMIRRERKEEGMKQFLDSLNNQIQHEFL